MFADRRSQFFHFGDELLGGEGVEIVIHAELLAIHVRNLNEVRAFFLKKRSQHGSMAMRLILTIATH